jgi:hypothetical protein
MHQGQYHFFTQPSLTPARRVNKGLATCHGGFSQVQVFNESVRIWKARRGDRWGSYLCCKNSGNIPFSAPFFQRKMHKIVEKRGRKVMETQ